MLTRILATLRAVGRPLCRADLQGELAVEASALQGMLDTLVARGRLRVVRFEDDGCGGCPIRSGCYIMAEQAALTYALPPGQAAEPLRGPGRAGLIDPPHVTGSGTEVGPGGATPPPW